MLRSLTAGALALALFGCDPPDVGHSDPQTVVTAVFDPTTAQIPLPNDLAFFNPVNSVCLPPVDDVSGPPACAQAELLESFQGKFPSDQALAITIDFTQTIYTNGVASQVAPELDFATLGPSNLFVFGTTAGGGGEVAIEPVTEADYAVGDDHGTLSIHHLDNEPWAPGAYTIVLRGGASGAKAKDGTPVSPSQVFALLEQGKDMTDPANLGLLRAQTGSVAAAIEQGKQLNLLIALYKTGVFPVADLKFPHQDLAIAATFKIADTVTNVEVDPARSKVPLPIDLLREPDDPDKKTIGTLTPLAACTLAGSHLDADGKCPSPAAAGFLALDGFSTTGAILAPTSDFVKVASAQQAGAVRLYELSDPDAPARVDPNTLIIEPCEFASGCTPTALAPLIAIQPAGATAGDPNSIFRTRPLKDATNYAVVFTTQIKDKADKPIGPGTVAKILGFSNAVSIDGKSQLSGIDNETALSLENMRLQLKPVFAALADDGVTKSQVAMAYTFRTQGFLGQAVQLAALPYIQDVTTAAPLAATASNAATAFSKFGVPAGVPSADIDQVIEADISTFNLLDIGSGAFNPDPAKAAKETIHVLITTPTVANTPSCIFADQTSGLPKCAPVMIFRHGMNRGRLDMLLIANSYAKLGMATIAIDAVKHGDRALCDPSKTGECNNGGACAQVLPAGAQGDATPPGTCGANGLLKTQLDGTVVTPGNGKDGIPKAAGNYLISANFFRTRDSLRQDLIDESQLIRALVVAPPVTGHKVFDLMAAHGVILDPVPGSIFYSGQSLGAIQGAANVAANPRIAKAAFNVGGGTLVDIFTNSPTFKPGVDLLLQSLGIVRGTAEFLQFLVVAKTILDPADPVNYIGHLTDVHKTLPNLLPPLGGNPNGTVPQLPKAVLSQMASCDQVVPNAFGFIYSSNLGATPIPPDGTPGTFQFFRSTAQPLPGCTAGAVPHSFLLDYANPTLTLQAQGDIAAFVRSGTLPPSVRQ